MERHSASSGPLSPTLPQGDLTWSCGVPSDDGDTSQQQVPAVLRAVLPGTTAGGG